MLRTSKHTNRKTAGAAARTTKKKQQHAHNKPLHAPRRARMSTAAAAGAAQTSAPPGSPTPGQAQLRVAELRAAEYQIAADLRAAEVQLQMAQTKARAAQDLLTKLEFLKTCTPEELSVIHSTPHHAARVDNTKAHHNPTVVNNAAAAADDVMSYEAFYPTGVADFSAYNAADAEALKVFWSTPSAARTAKLKELIVSKRIGIEDYAAIVANAFQMHADRQCTQMSGSTTRVSRLHYPHHLTLQANTDPHHSNFISVVEEWRGGALVEAEVYSYLQDFSQFQYYTFGMFPLGRDGCYFKPPPNRLITHLFEQRQLDAVDVATITAENIDAIDLDKVNIHDLVPRGADGQLVLSTARAYFFEPLRHVPYPERVGSFTFQDFFSAAAYAEQTGTLLTPLKKPEAQVFDFETWRLVDKQ